MRPDVGLRCANPTYDLFVLLPGEFWGGFLVMMVDASDYATLIRPTIYTFCCSVNLGAGFW